ncbi:MAG: hypothetical protein A2015_13585 [Spirochaetes bacterium GWF1_31_7]|nr:MAG: hypothetical protein A2Y30_11240 [Spirochaetes bacterium GWE1_32_154]OHD47923.1 MAG: hypothetical protein A2Y29_08060 [Spirochaetes bacterium GWE2_31_10]OHD49852.1 MAG: hypothetical protein A2015_13585 [Spirochaetes bacterium GWF1_31_7]OHD80650.1 MAG: hypothetical protein A2355_01235 [Spirochaetes bacterium RIFOXYB1_FULL_32_8]HBD92900.1 hypothetical protein [Spirochaetia bacterium]
MNIEQVKEKLVSLYPQAPDFLLVFTGKMSKKVHGLYKPEEKEILIHNKNFTDDNQLIYAAIHEFAHHINHTMFGPIITARSHTSKYQQIFHKLLKKAEEANIYTNPYKKDKEFEILIKRIKKNFLQENGQLMKELGGLLKEAHLLCIKHDLSFEDFVDRELNIHRNTAKTIIRVHEMDITPEIGYENMKLVSSIKDEEARKEAEEAFMEGESPDTVKGIISDSAKEKETDDPITKLQKEKEKIEKTIKNLNEKLDVIEKMIHDIHY